MRGGQTGPGAGEYPTTLGVTSTGSDTQDVQNMDKKGDFSSPGIIQTSQCVLPIVLASGAVITFPK